MRTLIFATAIRILTPVFLVFSIYILLRGHNHPGGGFIGGLIGSIAFVFHTLAHGTKQTNKSYFNLTFYKFDKKPDHGKFRHALRLLRKNIVRNKNEKPVFIWNYYLLRLRPTYLMATGLLVAVFSGSVGLFTGKPFMAAYWLNAKIPLIGSLGTPLLFDTGVYLLVLGMVLKMVFTMSKD
ncbi:multicomponent Na+:H+ antiporter subunit B [Pontibacter aydingkolensis]|uniref:Cation:proton antiporter n=1 Tax=Pontibacter aydingkolensis TaxID=1911536 RepID=A0ABS7CXH7_9BACT|nr:MnhB domain-containing protein [Pontibacter aydingkolensis]MBW7468534.1 cation:proton antiporter [Pontibacter aydingkolensis]